VENEAGTDEIAAGREEGVGHEGIKWAVNNSTIVLYYYRAF
jgi:hypothetical protein